MKSNLIYYQNELDIQRPADYPDNIYETFNKIVARVEPGSGKLIYTPWLHGERTPVDDNFLRGDHVLPFGRLDLPDYCELGLLLAFGQYILYLPY